MFSMNRLSQSERDAVVRCLVEGNSIRSTVRMTGIAKNTISKLLIELGAACSRFMELWCLVEIRREGTHKPACDALAKGAEAALKFRVVS